MDIGIDKILLTTKEFKVHSNNGLRVRQGDILPSGEILETQLYNDVKGTKAFLNGELANTTIDGRGLKVEYNPSKILHPYHLNNDNKSLFNVQDNVRRELKDNGILLGDNVELAVSRLDFARNVQMDQPIGAYGHLFSSLKAKRQSTKQFPNSYYHTNGSQESNFYDKGLALDYEHKGINVPVIEPNTMRGELRAKKRDSVGRIYKLNDMWQLLEFSPEYRLDKYKDNLKKQLFQGNTDPLQTSMFPDYNRQVEYLKALKVKHPRGAIGKFIQSVGIVSLLAEVGTMEDFRKMLLEAGYADKYSFRVIADLQKELHQSSMFYGDNGKQSLMKLYNEVYQKFVA